MQGANQRPAPGLAMLGQQLVMQQHLKVSNEGSCPSPDSRHSSRFVLDFANLTVFGKKVLNLLDNILEADKPDAWAFAECHLMGAHLGAARRRLRNLSWKTLATPAVPRVQKDFGLDDSAAAATEERKEDRDGQYH